MLFAISGSQINGRLFAIALNLAVCGAGSNVVGATTPWGASAARSVASALTCSARAVELWSGVLVVCVAWEFASSAGSTMNMIAVATVMKPKIIGESLVVLILLSVPAAALLTCMGMLLDGQSTALPVVATQLTA